VTGVQTCALPIFTIRCQDGGGVRGAVGISGTGFGRVSRVTEKSLQVNVVDVNDNSPVFSQTSYQGSIIENNYVGLSVLQVSTGSLGYTLLKH